jgi:Yip1 domain
MSDQTGTVLDYGRPDSGYARQRDRIPPHPGNEFRALVIKPFELFQWMVAADPMRYFWVLLVAGSLSESVLTYVIGTQWHIQSGGAPGTRFLFGAVNSILAVLLFAWLCSLAGGWIGGTGTARRCRGPIAWALLPITVGNLQFAAWAWLVGPEVLPIGGRLLSVSEQIFRLCIGLYALVLMSIGLGCAHRFSAWKGGLTIVIALAVLLAGVLVFVLPLKLLMR